MQAILLCLTLFAVHEGDDALRGCAYVPHVLEAADVYELPPRVFLAQGHVESGWKPWLVGASGERGAWQCLPHYAAMSKKRLAMPVPGMWEGARHLARRRQQAKGASIRLALAAYNKGGPGLKGIAGIEYADKVLSLSRTYRKALAAY